jgi:hypothetical protein
MKTVLVENTRTSRSIMDFGWGNGYVLIPEGHKYHGVEYDNIPVSVHGGLTYSKLVNEKTAELFGLGKDDIGKWCVGFDTYHLDDTLAKWIKEEVQKETDRLKEQLEAIK